MTKRKHDDPKPVTLQDYFKYPQRYVRRGELLQLLAWYERKRRKAAWWRAFWRWIVNSILPHRYPEQAVKDVAADIPPDEALKHGD